MLVPAYVISNSKRKEANFLTVKLYDQSVWLSKTVTQKAKSGYRETSTELECKSIFHVDNI